MTWGGGGGGGGGSEETVVARNIEQTDWQLTFAWPIDIDWDINHMHNKRLKRLFVSDQIR